MANEVQVDILGYPKSKADGLAKIIRINGQPMYTHRMFDQKTGKPIPLNNPIDRDSIASAIEAQQALTDAMKLLLADIDAAVEVVK